MGLPCDDMQRGQYRFGRFQTAARINLGDVKMKRTLVFALAMASLAANAHAADTNPPPSNSPFQLNPAQFKDPLPDSLTFWGVTFYATLDLGTPTRPTAGRSKRGLGP